MERGIGFLHHQKFFGALHTFHIAQYVQFDIGEGELFQIAFAVAADYHRQPHITGNAVKKDVIHTAKRRSIFNFFVIVADIGKLLNINLHIPERYIGYIAPFTTVGIFAVDMHRTMAVAYSYIAENRIADNAVAYTDADRVSISTAQYTITYRDPFARTFRIKYIAIAPQSNSIVAHIYNAITHRDVTASVNINSVILPDHRVGEHAHIIYRYIFAAMQKAAPTA